MKKWLISIVAVLVILAVMGHMDREESQQIIKVNDVQ